MEFRLRNARGDPVDPVPWLVVCGFAFLLSYGYLPLIFLEFELSLTSSLLLATVIFIVAVIVSFREQIRRARPDLAGEVPMHMRIRRLVLAIVIVILAMLALQVAVVLF